MAKECLVIPTEVLEKENIIPRERANQALYIPLSAVGGAEKIYRLATLYGEYRERAGDRNIENDPAFQQFIMYAFVLKDGKFLAYQRGSAEEGKYDEGRLEGKISLGVGGHIERSDYSLEYALFREIDEEAEVLERNEVVNFQTPDGLDIKKMKRYLDISPVALIKDERDEVGKVHLGIACRLSPGYSDVDIRVKTEGENVSFRYLSPKTYQQLTESNAIIPEGWSGIVFNNEILPTLSPSKYNPRG